MGGSFYTAAGAMMIIFGVAGVVLGNVSLRLWLYNGRKNGGSKK